MYPLQYINEFLSYWLLLFIRLYDVGFTFSVFFFYLNLFYIHSISCPFAFYLFGRRETKNSSPFLWFLMPTNNTMGNCVEKDTYSVIQLMVLLISFHIGICLQVQFISIICILSYWASSHVPNSAQRNAKY